MIKNRCIIVFGDDWGYYPSTIQHLGKVFASDNTLIWIGSLGLRKPQFSFSDFKRVWGKAKNILRTKVTPSTKKDNAVIQVHPFILPFHHWRLIYFLNMMVIKKTIKRELRRHHLQNPIVLTSSPIVAGIIGKLGETSSHYICLDDFTLFERAFDNLKLLEQNLVSKVDSCFAISKKLLETRKTASNNNYFLPQGVNTVHFSPSKEMIATAVRGIPKPIIGFFGLLTSWVNIGLILAAARRYPDYSFVILGKTHIDVSSLNGVSNIRYLGEVPFLELPSYARSFDVGIIPFIINELTIACNPLKLLEYLSLGIPVVSTNMPEVAKFAPHVIIADTDEEFIDAIRIAVNDISDVKNYQRRAIAEQYSWQSIAENISNVVERIELKPRRGVNPTTAPIKGN